MTIVFESCETAYFQLFLVDAYIVDVHIENKLRASDHCTMRLTSHTRVGVRSEFIARCRNVKGMPLRESQKVGQRDADCSLLSIGSRFFLRL